MPSVQPAEVGKDLVLRLGRVEIQPAFEHETTQTVRSDAGANQIPAHNLRRGGALDDEDAVAGPEVDDAQAVTTFDRLHFVEPQVSLRETAEEQALRLTRDAPPRPR